MAQAVRENGVPMKAPPGLDTNGSSSGTPSISPEHEALLDEVRRLIMADVETKVQERMKDIVSKGNKMMKQQEQDMLKKNEELKAEVVIMRQKQVALEAEHAHLKAVMAQMAQQLGFLGSFLGAPKAAPSTPLCHTATNGTTASTTASVQDNANNSSAASSTSIQDSPSSDLGAPGSLPPLPVVPDFPFPAGPTAAGTPLSLAEALSSDIMSPSVPVSLAGHLLPTTPMCFSFTLRKADGTDLGLNVSHHEEDKSLRVESVRPEGAVEAWNRQCYGSASTEKAIIAGDRIISVNAVAGDPAKMLEECRDKQLLKITVVRGEAPAAPKIVHMRADASEFVPGGAAAEAKEGTNDADSDTTTPKDGEEKPEGSADPEAPAAETTSEA